MSTDKQNRDPGDDTDLVEGLLRVAGAREDPPREDYEQVLAAASTALQAKLAGRRLHRGLRMVGMAAAVLAGLVVVWTLLPPEPVPAALSARVLGNVERRAAGTQHWRTLRVPDEPISAGDVVRTAAGARAALRLGAQSSLRLDEGTEVTLLSTERVELHRGAVYVDSGVADASRKPVEIVTPMGIAQDVGTQFEVRLLASGLRVRVREGMVVLRYAAASVARAAGEQLTLWSSGELERAALRSDDPGWSWTETVAVAPDIENQPLGTVLAWVVRETGRTVRYSSPEVERRAGAVIMHGSIRDLAPLDALDAVLAATDLSYAIMDDGSILIRPR